MFAISSAHKCRPDYRHATTILSNPQTKEPRSIADLPAWQTKYTITLQKYFPNPPSVPWLIRGFAKKKFPQKSKLTREVSGWVQVSPGIFLWKILQNSPKPVLIFNILDFFKTVHSHERRNLQMCAVSGVAWTRNRGHLRRRRYYSPPRFHPPSKPVYHVPETIIINNNNFTDTLKVKLRSAVCTITYSNKSWDKNVNTFIN